MTSSAKATASLSDTEKKMLELLLKGASGRVIAERLGYKEGTTRVYLHSLYKRIGVNNKTSAVTWYLDTIAAADQRKTGVLASSAYRVNTFGEMALKRGLLKTLGIMGVFLGPYGRMWEVAHKLKGSRGASVADEQLRAVSRNLWEALLAGDFVEGKRQFDAGILPKIFVAAPSDAVVLASLLVLGGYTASAKKAMAALPAKRGGSLGVTLDEQRALAATSDAIEKGSDSALSALHELFRTSNARPLFRHLLLVNLCHLYRLRADANRCMSTADALWAEAEAARGQLEAAGDRTLSSEGALPTPPAVTPAKLSSYLEKLIA